MTNKERFLEMEELLNDYYENIEDPFAITDISMEIVERVGYFVNRVQELEEENEELAAAYDRAQKEIILLKGKRDRRIQHGTHSD